jgi:hypothetical protein
MDDVSVPCAAQHMLAHLLLRGTLLVHTFSAPHSLTWRMIWPSWMLSWRRQPSHKWQPLWQHRPQILPTCIHPAPQQQPLGIQVQPQPILPPLHCLWPPVMRSLGRSQLGAPQQPPPLQWQQVQAEMRWMMSCSALRLKWVCSAKPLHQMCAPCIVAIKSSARADLLASSRLRHTEPPLPALTS